MPSHNRFRRNFGRSDAQPRNRLPRGLHIIIRSLGLEGARIVIALLSPQTRWRRLLVLLWGKLQQRLVL